MNMSVKPRYLLLAALAAGVLYAFGVSVGTLIFVLAATYMVSMHLGHGGGHGGGAGGHGGCGGHSERKMTPDITQTPSGKQPPAARGYHGHS